ncbi:MAG: hypothetical protein MI920_34050 [Kiloniellales bacterium]|nr:hypothetical protein [Kiloniellales bacterium]
MERTFPRVMIAVGLALLLAACATPTPYQAASGESAYGFREERLDPQTWRLHFSGNSVTEREQVEDYLLYRAAELADKEGARGFVVLDRNTERQTHYIGIYQPSFGHFSTHGYFRSSHYHFLHRPGFGATTLRPIDRYTAHATVRLFDEQPPEGLGVPYDANEVISTIGPRIVRPGSAQS